MKLKKTLDDNKENFPDLRIITWALDKVSVRKGNDCYHCALMSHETAAFDANAARRLTDY